MRNATYKMVPEILCAKCYMRNATCEMIHAKCYMRNATCKMLHAKCYLQPPALTLSQGGLNKFWGSISPAVQRFQQK